MSLRTVLVAVLVLQIKKDVLARPSETAPVPAHVRANLLAKENIHSGCPDTLDTPQEMSGDWCGLLNSGDNSTSESCIRTTISSDGDRLRWVRTSIENGQIKGTMTAVLSKIDNGSWLKYDESKTANFFFGFSSDRKYLLICGTLTETGRIPEETYGFAHARCLQPGEEGLVEAGLRPNVQRCNVQTTSS